jgi:hypothetical protein
MRKLFYVDLEMCGGDSLPAEFDLEDFCEVLQRKVADIEIVPAVGMAANLANRDNRLIHPHVFNEALGEYCRL